MANRHARRTARHTARDTGGTRRRGLAHYARTQPLLVVGASLLMGMALGALLPWREIEDDLLGDQAEKLKDGALEMASDGYEKAKSVAQRGYEAASEILSSGKSDSDAGGGSTGTTGPVGQKTTPAIEPHAR